jgi:hypothetical protein
MGLAEASLVIAIEPVRVSAVSSAAVRVFDM